MQNVGTKSAFTPKNKVVFIRICIYQNNTKSAFASLQFVTIELQKYYVSLKNLYLLE